MFGKKKKRVKTKTIYILKIYLKNDANPLCEVEVPKLEAFDEFEELMGKSNEFIRYGQVIFLKKDFGKATIEEQTESY